MGYVFNFTDAIAYEQWFEDQSETVEYQPLDWFDMKEKCRIEKRKALDLFKDIYEMKELSQTALTKQLGLHKIHVKRQGSGMHRRQYYKWD